jgi:hypothetical protein
VRIDVDGGWANIRDPRKLPGRLAELVEDAQFALIETPGGEAFSDEARAKEIQGMPAGAQMRAIGLESMRALRELKRVNVLAYVDEWSFGAVTRDVLLDLPDLVLNAIAEKVGEVVKATGGPRVDVEPTPDAASPSMPSNG